MSYESRATALAISLCVAVTVGSVIDNLGVALGLWVAAVSAGVLGSTWSAGGADRGGPG